MFGGPSFGLYRRIPAYVSAENPQASSHARFPHLDGSLVSPFGPLAVSKVPHRRYIPFRAGMHFSLALAHSLTAILFFPRLLTALSHNQVIFNLTIRFFPPQLKTVSPSPHFTYRQSSHKHFFPFPCFAPIFLTIFISFLNPFRSSVIPQFLPFSYAVPLPLRNLSLL